MPKNSDGTSTPSYKFCAAIEDKDIYKYVLDTRNFEISLFWQRSNYFLVLNSALAVGFFTIKTPVFMYLFAAFGFVTSALWLQVMKGSKYWQIRWEHQLRLVEEAIDPNLKLFCADHPTLDGYVKASIDKSNHTGIQRWLDGEILKKPSVSYSMTLLSFSFMFGWAVVLFLVTVLPQTWLCATPCTASTISNEQKTISLSGVTSSSINQSPPIAIPQNTSPTINVNVSVNGKPVSSGPTKTTQTCITPKKDCANDTPRSVR